MQRDDAYLLDILTSAQLAVSYLETSTFEAFQVDPILQDAVIRRLAVIGEAAGRVSEDRQASAGDLPWRKMISMRNLLIHEYDDVDLYVVWETVKTSLPELIRQLDERFPGFGSEPGAPPAGQGSAG